MKFKLIMIIMVFLVVGCGRLVPQTIKRETSLARIDMENVVFEAKKKHIQSKKLIDVANEAYKIEDYKTASKNYKEANSILIESQEKVLRSYERASESIRNVENYMYSKPPEEKSKK